MARTVQQNTACASHVGLEAFRRTCQIGWMQCVSISDSVCCMGIPCAKDTLNAVYALMQQIAETKGSRKVTCSIVVTNSQ
jgi:hypothetical protein